MVGRDLQTAAKVWLIVAVLGWSQIFSDACGSGTSASRDPYGYYDDNNGYGNSNSNGYGSSNGNQYQQQNVNPYQQQRTTTTRRYRTRPTRPPRNPYQGNAYQQGGGNSNNAAYGTFSVDDSHNQGSFVPPEALNSASNGGSNVRLRQKDEILQEILTELRRLQTDDDYE